jgi:hypothetical protein
MSGTNTALGSRFADRPAFPARLVLAAVACAAACAPRAGVPSRGVPTLPPGHVAPAPPAAIPADANFVLRLSEAVGTPEEDVGSYVKVVIDGEEAGQVAMGPKSQERLWGVRLPPGNHLFRFEYSVLSLAGPWVPLDAQWQPAERFIRVEDKFRVKVSLKFYDGARRHQLEIARAGLGVIPK